jgi:hypothetical protein
VQSVRYCSIAAVSCCTFVIPATNIGDNAGLSLSCLEFPLLSACLRGSDLLLVVMRVGLLFVPCGIFFVIVGNLWVLGPALFLPLPLMSCQDSRLSSSSKAKVFLTFILKTVVFLMWLSFQLFVCSSCNLFCHAVTSQFHQRFSLAISLLLATKIHIQVGGWPLFYVACIPLLNLFIFCL